MIDLAKWMATEHPVLFFFGMLFAAWAVNGLGRIGSTKVKVKREKRDA